MPKPKRSYGIRESIFNPFVPRREAEEIFALLKQAAENADPPGEVEISDSSSVYESIAAVAGQTLTPETLELGLDRPGSIKTFTVYISRSHAAISGDATDEDKALAAEISKIIKRRSPSAFVQNFRYAAPVLAAALLFVGGIASASHWKLPLPFWIVMGPVSASPLALLYPLGKVRLFKSGAYLRPLVDEQQGWIRVRERLIVSALSGGLGFVLGWFLRALKAE